MNVMSVAFFFLVSGSTESIQPSLSATHLTSPTLPNVETASPTVPATPSSQDKAEGGASEAAEATGQYQHLILFI